VSRARLPSCRPKALSGYPTSADRKTAPLSQKQPFGLAVGTWQFPEALPFRLHRNGSSYLLFWRVFFTRTGIHFARKRYCKQDRLEGSALPNDVRN
jgi:hypothetical protein